MAKKGFSCYVILPILQIPEKYVSLNEWIQRCLTPPLLGIESLIFKANAVAVMAAPAQ